MTTSLVCVPIRSISPIYLMLFKSAVGNSQLKLEVTCWLCWLVPEFSQAEIWPSSHIFSLLMIKLPSSTSNALKPNHHRGNKRQCEIGASSPSLGKRVLSMPD